MLGELDAAAIFPRRVAEPTEVSSGVIFLIENSMVNAFDVSVNVVLFGRM
jgi:3-hydroxyacyl-CoA dehydrogenase